MEKDLMENVEKLERSISPLGWAVIEDSPQLARRLIEQEQASLRDAIKLGESALGFAIRRGASVPLVRELLRHPRLDRAELAATLASVMHSVYMDRRYQRDLCRALQEATLGRAATPISASTSAWGLAILERLKRAL